MNPVTLGVIVGTRGFFPGELCIEGRDRILKVLEAEGIRAVLLGVDDTPYGSIESLEDARKCADLFKAHEKEIDGILVTLPNFGDERAVSNAIRWSGLDVPVLVHAYPDKINELNIEKRRDSFCGKMSCCNNLRQYGIKYSLTTLHTVDPEDASFRFDLRKFAAVCRIVTGMKNIRVGMLGARPSAFNTVRFSEKLLERAGISVEPMDLSELLGRIGKLHDDDQPVLAKLEELKSYVSVAGISDEGLMRMAKMGVVIDAWMKEQNLVATSIQCWTSLEENYGIVPCAVMSMMSNQLLPSACETDITGLVGMYAMVLASGKPSGIADWNNNYGNDPDKCVLFHCSNFPKDFFVKETISAADAAKMDYQAIIAGDVGKENTYGTLVGRLRTTPMTYLRVSTDDFSGKIVAYVGEGELTDDPMQTFGGYGVAHINHLQGLLKYICENGLEHHVAISPVLIADAVEEALQKYLGWSVYHHW